jgi:hypothetical protein
MNAAPLNSHKAQLLRPLILFHYLVCDPGKDPLDVLFIEELLVHHLIKKAFSPLQEKACYSVLASLVLLTFLASQGHH